MASYRNTMLSAVLGSSSLLPGFRACRHPPRHPPPPHHLPRLLVAWQRLPRGTRGRTKQGQAMMISRKTPHHTMMMMRTPHQTMSMRGAAQPQTRRRRTKQHGAMMAGHLPRLAVMRRQSPPALKQTNTTAIETTEQHLQRHTPSGMAVMRQVRVLSS